MILYLIKSILCSGLFLGLYMMLLEKENNHHFKRFFLLLALAASFLVPALTLTTYYYTDEQPTFYFILDKGWPLTTGDTTLPVSSSLDTEWLLAFAVYIIVTLWQLFQFISNLHILHQHMKAAVKIRHNGYTLLLLEQSFVPHTFLHFILLSRADWENGSLPQEILDHEQAHVRQKHSFDILFIEILRIIFWFHPFLSLYKRSIKLNHEFLADAAVIHSGAEISDYQKLLLSRINATAPGSLCSTLHFLITKKRFIMMSRKTNAIRLAFKTLLLIPALAGIAMLFGADVMAQQKSNTVPPQVTIVTPVGEGATPEMMAEYQTIIEKYSKNDSIWWQHLAVKITPADRSRLETIFRRMNKAQQDQQFLVFAPPPPPLRKVKPTSQQMQQWHDDKKYGVWINNKRVSNDKLQNYSADDFSQVFVSKLSKTAINYGKHYYQVDLMTNERYDSYLKSTQEDTRYWMMFKQARRNKK